MGRGLGVEKKGVVLNLPQFNGYFYWATMSPQEYPNDDEEKAIQDIHARIQTGSDPLDGIIGQTLIGDCD